MLSLAPDPKLHLDRTLHRYTYDGVWKPNVTTILEAMGFIDKEYFTPESRTRGDYVHRLAHFHDIGTLDWDTVDADLMGYLHAYLKFKEETGFVPYLCEFPLYHRLYQYCGCLDRFGLFTRGPWKNAWGLIDLKSGPVAYWCGLQTAAYALPVKQMPELREIRGKKAAFMRLGVQLKPDGAWHPTVFEDIREEGIFLCQVSGYNYKLNHGGLKNGQGDPHWRRAAGERGGETVTGRSD